MDSVTFRHVLSSVPQGKNGFSVTTLYRFQIGTHIHRVPVNILKTLKNINFLFSFSENLNSLHF